MIRKLITAVRQLAASPAPVWKAVVGTSLIGAGAFLAHAYASEIGELADDAEKRYAALVDKHDALAANVRTASLRLAELRKQQANAEDAILADTLTPARAAVRDQARKTPMAGAGGFIRSVHETVPNVTKAGDELPDEPVDEQGAPAQG